MVVMLVLANFPNFIRIETMLVYLLTNHMVVPLHPGRLAALFGKHFSLVPLVPYRAIVSSISIL